jgi:hypothetical protein
MTAAVLFVLTGVLATLSLVSCALLGRFRSVGVLSGLLLATTCFLFIAWWQPFRDHPEAVHLGLLAIGVAAAGGLWWTGRAAQAFGVTAAVTLACWVLFSAVIFPAMTRPEGLAQAYRAEIEALAAGRPYCTVSKRQLMRNYEHYLARGNGELRPDWRGTLYNPSFLAAPWKQDVRPDWSNPTRFLYSWIDQSDIDLVLYIRTGEPQLRLAWKHQWNRPGGLYDITALYWGGDKRAFRPSQITELPADLAHLQNLLPIDGFGVERFACIPRVDYLTTGAPQGMVEMSTRYGDFVVPDRLAEFNMRVWYDPEPGGDPEIEFSVPGAELLPGVPNAPALTFAFRRFDHPRKSVQPAIFDAADQWVQSRDDLVALGYTENADGLLANPARGEGTPNYNDDEPQFVASDAAGGLVTAIHCRTWSDGSTSCNHQFLAADLHPDATEDIWVTYPADLLPHWREIEAKARALVSSFAVPGAIPPEKLRARPDPDCIAENDSLCLSYDTLP